MKDQTVIASLSIRGAAKAIEFYKDAFGAEENFGRIGAPGGKVGHAELEIGNSILYIADEWADGGIYGPDLERGSSVNFNVNVPNVDEMVQRAVDHGAKLVRPVEKQFYGHRTGTISDGFGYRWTFSTAVEEVSNEEMQRRAKELYGE